MKISLTAIILALALTIAAAATAADYAAAVSDSDDYAKYKAAFDKAAKTLIEDGRCTAAELKELGGFWRSQEHGDKPIYFTYCGGMHLSKQILLDVSTGRIFKR